MCFRVKHFFSVRVCSQPLTFRQVSGFLFPCSFRLLEKTFSWVKSILFLEFRVFAKENYYSSCECENGNGLCQTMDVAGPNPFQFCVSFFLWICGRLGDPQREGNFLPSSSSLRRGLWVGVNFGRRIVDTITSAAQHTIFIRD